MTPIDYHNLDQKKKKDYYVYIGLAVMMIFWLLVLMDYQADALQFNESIPGERNTEDWFTFTMHNVSGQEDVTHHVTVYGSKLMDPDEPYQYWSEYFGQTLNQTPDKGKRWLFIWAEDWIEGCPTWSFDQSHFIVWAWGNTTITAAAGPAPGHQDTAGQEVKPGNH